MSLVNRHGFEETPTFEKDGAMKKPDRTRKLSPRGPRAVRLVQEHRAEYPSLWAAVESIAPKIGCVPHSLLEAPMEVGYGGYRSGRSCQGAPVRASIHGRPPPSARRGVTGIKAANSCHCASVRSISHLYSDLLIIRSGVMR